MEFKQSSLTGQPSLIHIQILSGKTSQIQVILKIKSLLKDNYVVQYVTIISIKIYWDAYCNIDLRVIP